MEVTPTVPRICGHIYNGERIESGSHCSNNRTTSFFLELSNNATMIEENGRTAKLLIVGLLPCLDQLRTEHWINNVRILEIVGTVHSCRHMFKIIQMFNNLMEWKILIHPQYSPSELRLTQPEEQYFNNSITNIAICADSGSFRGKSPECQRGIVSVVIFCLKMASKSRRLTSFLIDVPHDDGNKIFNAVGDFIQNTNLDTPITTHRLLGKIFCSRTAVAVENLNVPRTGTLQPLLTPIVRNVVQPLPTPGKFTRTIY